MTSTESPLFTTRALTAEAGQTLLVPVAAGTFIQLTQGSVQLTQSPRWLAETMFWADVRLGEGEAHQVAQSGWLSLRVLGDGAAQWLQHEPAPIRVRAARQLRALVQALRRAGRYALGGANFASKAARRSRLSAGQISEAL
ncbi:hypothetical protein QTH91_00115 [Variovorax dokdonensis]|uniref:DUF2917 domain-containing protein n=1 Tax=Variovorax dokdonensis TaxID=344883 RepID=A0ABT7N4L3_9BURK|nr:hypothetical protein [Variovorax dokdonensis]MDM0042871.1 hypothetical protein [Variovorax dokdonensis]